MSMRIAAGDERIGAVGALFLAGLALTPRLAAHEPRYVAELAWTMPEVTRTLGLKRSLGLRGRPETRVERVGESDCVVGTLFGFDVDDDFGYDLDETVELEVTLTGGDRSFTVVYDKSGSAESRLSARARAAGGWARATVGLPRARFANRGPFGTDLAVGSGSPDALPLTICDLRLRRGTPRRLGAPGRLTLRLTRGGAPAAARVGLYDGTGRSPLPSADAVPVRYFSDLVRQVAVRRGEFWPAPNRWVFYVDGDYAAELPAGDYQLVVMRGPEHRLERRRFAVRAGAETRLEVELERWADLPAAGWYSGDAHIHMERAAADNPRVLAQIAAEDLHVGNLLQMGNIAGTGFRQYAWGDEGRFARGGTVLVSGQEDPRTARRGHTISLNLRAPIRDPDRYFLYHEVFEEVHRQGGLAGYAHLPAEWFNVYRGLALDVPFELVDFLEVLQIGLLQMPGWYQYLDLGFKLTPVAGSDFPYVDLPGTVRTYAKVEGGFSADAWFDAVAAGRTFVTNGPLLELDAGGAGMGEELRLEAPGRLRVRASAAINPDLDRMERLELVVHGEVVESAVSAEGVERLELDVELEVGESLWLAVRARARRQEGWSTVVAHSAPVYVVVEGRRFWNRAKVRKIVDNQRYLLRQLVAARLAPAADLESWATAAELERQWPRQRARLEERVRAAEALYDKLLTELEAAEGPQARHEGHGAGLRAELGEESGTR